jgi:hypothetical protein
MIEKYIQITMSNVPMASKPPMPVGGGGLGRIRKCKDRLRGGYGRLG